MVFLFPGVLFRKFYFTGKFGNQFDQGNLLERFLWSLFLSFICLISVALLFHVLETYFGITPLDNIEFKTLSSIFEDLTKNKYPTTFSIKDDFIDFLFLLFFIYVISGFLGWWANKLVRLFSFDNIPVFKFSNSWHYLSLAHRENGVAKKIGDVHTTFVDVLVKNNSKDTLYRGILNNFVLDKEDKLENLVLANVYKFVTVPKEQTEKIESIDKSIENEENIFDLHKEFIDKKVYKKSIDGDLLVLFKEDIVNINFTYVKTSNRVSSFFRFIYKGLKTLLIIAGLFLVLLPFLEVEIYALNSVYKKVVFSFTTFFVLKYFENMIKAIMGLNILDKKLGIWDHIYILSLLFTPYLWVLNITNAWYTFLVGLIIVIIYSNRIGKRKKTT